MKVCYNKLWKLLIDKGMKKSQLRVAVGAKALLLNLGKTKMSHFLFCLIYANI
jgi:putative transcriptional regulator